MMGQQSPQGSAPHSQNELPPLAESGDGEASVEQKGGHHEAPDLEPEQPDHSIADNSEPADDEQ